MLTADQVYKVVEGLLKRYEEHYNLVISKGPLKRIMGLEKKGGDKAKEMVKLIEANARKKVTINKQQYIEVPKKTILQHIKSPWKNILHEQKYYFCEDPDCEVVYFGLNGSVISKYELRTIVGIKENHEEAPACYCFGISKALANKYPLIKEFVIQQTKEHNCSCDVKNPSGRCCLKDFPKSH